MKWVVLLGLFERINWRLGRQLVPLFREENLTPKDIVVMLLVSKKDKCAITKMADYLGVPFSTFTEVLDRLESKGLIERIPNPKSRRSMLVISTSSGLELLDKIERKIEMKMEEIFKELSEDTYHQIFNVLNALNEYLNDEEV
ncbi:MarR family winged helix-turn-helix transcriptional regulator [Thermoanaerobacterium thermosaccharolyticum]|uniref:MarR family winged helix-turn-helix transcriptional regulator n=1 Tax=Thermoanaerobacterium thermosaccharolyticum TaxID=1517 RepID=UPI0010441D0B|nr:MarR family transcriptional regulator [Thermoanaerobacterium thermosaccharolyticum]MBE0067951.1 MarR family transcriptional regulator [Thermoanaerobacterium thermosaccharolyticum]MBE0227689.1 MarR family transcriptional regulator [Thermoanaerobacterium thermosaccharolyticum]TCW36738.1 DNA-binding MarR family transcriptional regulator [Thermohydrogenium kirishiense]